MRLLGHINRPRPVPYARGLRVRVVEPEGIRLLAEREPDINRRAPVLDWLSTHQTGIKRAYIIELREPPRSSGATVCWLLILSTHGPAVMARIEVRKADFHAQRRCRSEDLHVIADYVAAVSTPLNFPPFERPDGAADSASHSGQDDTND